MKSLAGWCRILTAVFAMIVAASVAAVALDTIAVSYLLRVSAGSPLDMSTAEAVDTSYSIVSFVQLGLFLLSAVLFLIWFYRADKNLVETGTVRLKYSPRWAVGGFLVPVLNAVRPFQVMAEVWSGSRYLSDPQEGRTWVATQLTSFVGLWWMLFLAMNLVAYYAGNLLADAATLNELIRGVWLQTAGDLLSILAAIATIKLIRRVTAMQEAAAARWHPVGLPQAA